MDGYAPPPPSQYGIGQRPTSAKPTKLKKFLLRYYPPGIILEYTHFGELRQKAVDLLNLTPDTDVEVLLNQIMRQEPLIKESRRAALRAMIYRLVDKQAATTVSEDFQLYKVAVCACACGACVRACVRAHTPR